MREATKAAHKQVTRVHLGAHTQAYKLAKEVGKTQRAMFEAKASKKLTTEVVQREARAQKAQ
jgi:hypothetical protein